MPEIIDLNELARELHAAAVEKGFWDVEEAEIKHIAKMHSELSEALQEDRCGRPLLYVDDIEELERVTDIYKFDGRKPEGVAAELADFVMMTLDWARQRKDTLCPLREVLASTDDVTDIEAMSLPELVNIMHEGVVMVDNAYRLDQSVQLTFTVRVVELWLEFHGCDLWQIIRLKMEYNQSRPKLHGRAY